MAEVTVNMVTPPAPLDEMTITAVYDEGGDDTVVTGLKVTNPTDMSCNMDGKAAPATEADITRFQVISAPTAVEFFRPNVDIRIYWNPGQPHTEGNHTVYLLADGLDGNGEPVSELCMLCHESM